MSIRTKLQLGILGTGGVALLVFGLILAWTSQQVSEAIEQSKAADEVVKGVFELSVITNDYLLHHEERAQTQWGLRYASLARLLTEAEFKDPEEHALLGQITQTHADIQPLFSQLVTNYEGRDLGEEEAALSLELEQRLAGQLGVKAQTMVADTFRLAEAARARVEGAQRRGSFLLMAFDAIILTLMVSAIFLASNNIVERIMNLHRGTEIIAAGDLEYQVGVGSRDEIGDLALAFNEMTRRLRESYGALKEYSDRLEEMVEERTAQLEAANKELEAFAYSVSHDLRAPLRAMDGFSRILLEEHAPELSPGPQRYLHLVCENARQMGQLIDDLLIFSRLSRHPLKKQPTAPADLVRQTLQELHADQEGREVEITIGDLPACQADPSLLKQVFANLLGNALKFSRGREVARIEIGCQQGDDESVYFVKDNGTGFDMQYADKLFGVFQRLHRAEDYEGTGVGLAIVQRIIHRHGGRIWAEAEADKGATFYFALQRRTSP